MSEMASCRNDQNPLTIMDDLSGLKIPLSRAKLAGQRSVGDPVLELEASKNQIEAGVGWFPEPSPQERLAVPESRLMHLPGSN